MNIRLKLLIMVALLAEVTDCWCASPSDVAVVINENSAVSKEIGTFYAAKRGIPAKNIIHIKCSPDEIVDLHTYQQTIEKPVKAYLEKSGLSKTVDYIVLTKGIPVRVSASWAVDSLLTCMDMPWDFERAKSPTLNPYYRKNEHFSRTKYGFYAVTRLDGYTLEDAKALVDRSLTAKASKGIFLLDSTPMRDTPGYRAMNIAMRVAHELLTKKGFHSILDDGPEFVGGRTGLIGYFSWGSNDTAFDIKKYKSNRFLPGAIADTAVSTSARTFKKTTEPGQSLIADLIEAGVTGVKGYPVEPTLGAISDPAVLFDRYTSGFNLAESFYAASQAIRWRDIVIGDPLCAPFAKKQPAKRQRSNN